MAASRWFHGWAVVAALGCTPKTTTPMGAHAYPRAEHDGERPRALLVLLPGRGDEGVDFERHGFIAALARSELDVDVIALDAHYGYYRDRSLPEHVHTEVLAPNRARYDQIWLMGISMGGIGALLVAERHPDEVDGVILFAPYLGRRHTIEAVMHAGGLAKWTPPEHPKWDQRLWAWMKRTDTPIYLGYGTEDFGARAHVVLAAALPKDHVLTRPGEHGWSTWTPLFDDLLARIDHATIVK